LQSAMQAGFGSGEGAGVLSGVGSGEGTGDGSGPTRSHDFFQVSNCFCCPGLHVLNAEHFLD